MDRYEQLKKVIQTANPEILELKFGCQVALYGGEFGLYTVVAEIGMCSKHKKTKEDCYEEASGCEVQDAVILISTDDEGVSTARVLRADIKDYEIDGRPIRLADVLLAIGKLNGDSIGVDAEGFVISREWDKGIGLSPKWNEQGTHRMYRWNLKDDNLDHQPDECKQFWMDLFLSGRRNDEITEGSVPT